MLDKYWNITKREGGYFWRHFKTYCKWVVISVLFGLVMGLVCVAFSYCLGFFTTFRQAHGDIIWCLPLAGLFIAFLYQTFDKPTKAGHKGTNMVLAAVNSDEQISFRTTPLIFVSTLISHLFGASVGREGAALQMGASMGSTLAKVFHVNENDKRILIMTGMSAAFAGLFGAPVTAAIFSMEVISVGVMYYAALVPCTIAGLTSVYIAKLLGVNYDVYRVDLIPDFTPYTATMTMLLGVGCAVISIVLCLTLVASERFMNTVFQSPYVQIFVAGTMVSILTMLVGNQDYNGFGAGVIMAAVTGRAVWYAFLLKIVFTAISLSGGYRGGEIIPSLFIGAAFGCAVGPLLGLPAGLCAAMGMIAVFCGVTNSPIASFVMGLELFGSQSIWFFAIVVAVSYMLSGYYGIYKSQIIIYSKYKTSYIRQKTLR